MPGQQRLPERGSTAREAREWIAAFKAMGGRLCVTPLGQFALDCVDLPGQRPPHEPSGLSDAIRAIAREEVGFPPAALFPRLRPPRRPFAKRVRVALAGVAFDLAFDLTSLAMRAGRGAAAVSPA